MCIEVGSVLFQCSWLLELQPPHSWRQLFTPQKTLTCLWHITEYWCVEGIYRSLAKEYVWVEHLRNLGERCFECFCIQPWRATPCHICSDWMPSKQIIGKTVTYNWTTNSFKVEYWQHTTLRIAQCYLSMCSLQCICYIHIVTTFSESSLSSAWGCASKTPWVHHTKLAPEWVLIRIRFDPGNGAKSRWWPFFRVWALFYKLMVYAKSNLKNKKKLQVLIKGFSIVQL